MIRTCRVCGITSDKIKFHADKNLCVVDYRKYMKSWAKKNKERLKEYRSTPEFKEKRRVSVSKAQQRSPEAFIRTLSQHIRKYSNYKKKTQHKLNPQCLDVQIDYDYLLNLYKQQKGLCALSKIVMTHEFNKLTTISVDRIDSNKGYIPGNVQLVCQWVNTAKRHYSNAEFQKVLDMLRSQ